MQSTYSKIYLQDKVVIMGIVKVIVVVVVIVAARLLQKMFVFNRSYSQTYFCTLQKTDINDNVRGGVEQQQQ